MQHGCEYSKAMQGDCSHHYGLPFPEDETTTDEYGKPHSWCWWCWLTELRIRAETKCKQVEQYLKERDEYVEKLALESFDFVIETDCEDDGPKWLGLDLKWTHDTEQALRFARKIDAISFCSIAKLHCHPPINMYPIDIPAI